MSTESPPRDARIIGLTGATMIGVGAIVGGGVLALAGVAFASAGPAAILAFLLNGIIAYLTAMAYAEMATAFPENGGAYAFTKKVLSVQAAFAVGWVLFFASIAAGVLYALGFAAYATEATAEIWRLTAGTPPDWLHSRFCSILLAAGSVIFYAILLTRKPGGDGALETVGKIVVFVIIIIAGFYLIARHPQASVGNGKLSPFFGGNGVGGLIAAMGFTFITLQGFDIIAAVAGEVKEPGKVIPKAMFVALGVALVIYMPLLFVIMTVGVPEGQTIRELAQEYPETMIAEAVRNFLGPTGFWLVMVAALLSMLSALFANLLAASRIALSMASDRTLPAKLAVLNPTSGNPVRAIWVSAVIMGIILVVVPNVAAAGAAASLIFLVSFLLTHLTNILARRRGGPGFGVFKAPWFPVLQAIGAACCFGLAVFQGINEKSAGLLVTLWLGAGFLLYFTTLVDRASVWDAQVEASNPELVKLRGRSPLVLVPIANPKHASGMVEVAHALTPPSVGRVLLLSIMAGDVKWQDGNPPAELGISQDVLGEALGAAVQLEVKSEALVTMANEPWAEIVRVANLHRCESVLLGLSDLSGAIERLPIEATIQAISSDVVVLGGPVGWQLSQVDEILVPTGGAGGHDLLRARLLTSLCRKRARRITYLRVVPEETTEAELKRMTRELRISAEDESPSPPQVLVVPHADAVQAVAEHAASRGLIILGTRRTGRTKAIGPFAISIARQVSAGIILISRKA